MYYIIFYCIIRTNKTISFPCKPGVLKYKFKTLINVHMKYISFYLKIDCNPYSAYKLKQQI